MTGTARDDLLILVVEDETLTATALEVVLKRAGYRILGPAATLVEARRLIDSCRPDLALIDYRLSVSTTEALLSDLHEYAVPTCVLTGYSRTHLPPAYVDLRVLQKPFCLPSLLETISQLAA